jgi:hypothetical protein
MDSKEMTRKEFITLTFTLIGSVAAVGACDDNNTNTTGVGGSNGTAVTYGAGGHVGTGGHAGTTAAGGTTGTAGTTGQGGAGGTGTSACTDPLPESQLPDTTGHTHTVTVPASTLTSLAPQTFPTSVTLAHSHTVMLAVANLATLRNGGSVTVTSSASPLDGHMHMFMVSCH